MTITPALKAALNDAISSGKFVDTQIILYSRRDSSGRVCKPKPLYANSHVLKCVPYFNTLLSGAFSESEMKDFSETVDDGEIAEDYGYSSDSDLEEDWDFDTTDLPKRQSQLLLPEVSYGHFKEHDRVGKVIRIGDVAFITFQAFLLYLYTNSIGFAPFGSGENRKLRSPEISWSQEGEIPGSSPKSMYRLADKYDVPPLKKAALRKIKDGLSDCDIVEETFSAFGSRYREIMVMQVEYLLHVWLMGENDQSRAVRGKLEEKMEDYASGKLDHAEDTMLCIWQASHNEGPTYPDSASSSPSLSRISLASLSSKGFTGCNMRSALINSIRNGYLLDRKYWAKRSRQGAVEPVYFSSAAIWAELSSLDVALERHLGPEDHLSGNDEDEYIEDSDYEDELESAGEPISQGLDVGSEKSGEQKLLSVLKMGSSVAWKSLFFYLLSGEIRFAPLKSLGLKNRSEWVLAKKKLGSPAPCSPKTIYQLAKALSWKKKSTEKTLSDKALKEIEAKLTQENIATETFSRFAARHPEIIVMGWKHLGKELKTERTTASVMELIKEMKGGNATHQIDALKFGLYSALRQKGPDKSTLTRLRCSTETCSVNKSPITYDALGGKLICPKHAVSTPSMKCSECDHVRVDHCTWCKGCRRVFE